jgi:hypothetical protein
MKNNFNIGDRIQIKQGATKWMKEHEYWTPEMGESIDELYGQIAEDYTDLPGNDSHFGINIGFDFIVGVHPMWLLLV